jgi:hypothetical protein
VTQASQPGVTRMSQLLLHVMLVVDADPEPTATKQQHY